MAQTGRPQGKRAGLANNDGSSSKRLRRGSPANPLGIKPLGNLLYAPEHALTRAKGLGRLALLPDELLLSGVFSRLDAEDLLKMAATSRAFYAWSCVEGMWKGHYIERTHGRLSNWRGSWRASFLAHERGAYAAADVATPTLHSDVLFQPALCAGFNANKIFSSPSFSPSIPRIDGRNLSPSTMPHEPAILTDLMSDWPAMSDPPNRRWTLPHLAERFPDIALRAEATLTTLHDYGRYHDDCPQDESPLYLFESEFVKKTTGRQGPDLGDDYRVPACFSEDLFEVMGAERPDYRWLIVGPTRSGSTWHVDPNHTSAWNAVTVGEKAWVMFPPDVTPPGVYASEDGAQVEAPLSLAEWFLSYYDHAKRVYGPRATDSGKRGKMREGICRAGEILYVPSGWWHIVVNLTPATAVTQNYVSHRELPAVLRFMRDRPLQVSGFKLEEAGAGSSGGLHEDECDETGGGHVFERFVAAMRIAGGDKARVVEDALSEIGGEGRDLRDARDDDEEGGCVQDKKVGLWETLKAQRGTPPEVEKEGTSVAAGGSFSFGFGLELGEEEEA
ncbi:hypothetical protein JCM3774_002192 [Rhodotorula dairenensis]